LSKIERIGLSQPSGKATFTENCDTTSKEVVTLRWAEISASKINDEQIFKAIANQDFHNRSPQLKGNIFFIDPEKHLILHMYDDRGLDVIATNPTALQHIYSVCNDWILDYDRDRIDDTVAGRIWEWPEIFSRTRVSHP
jgi:hypothetical protein